jgi:hypothetical protein
MKKDTGKWCDFHKILWNNTNECHLKKSLVVDMQALKSDPGSKFDSKIDKGKHVIDENPSATVATTKV